MSAARGLFEAGDRARALEAIEAALAIDPEFLGAQALRARILDPTDARPATPATTIQTHETILPASPAGPLVSVEGYARFEARAKRRRVDRRVEAARAAIAARRLKEAASALDEVIELDPSLPELTPLTADFDNLRRETARSHRGPWIAAGAAFVIVMLAAPWLQDSRLLLSRRTVSAVAERVSPRPFPPSPPLEPPQPIFVPPMDARIAVPTTGERDVRDEAAGVRSDTTSYGRAVERAAVIRTPLMAQPEPAQASRPPSAPAVTPTAIVPAAAPLSANGVGAVVAPPPTTFPAATPPPVAPPAPVSAASLEGPATGSTLIEDERLVTQTLQRYRKAYEALDAGSAQAVWPAVNQVALARAFDGLESQTLTFDACDVQLRGDTATATCRGTARYVPKIGSREPRVEPRVWNFTLRRSGADWRIDNARAQ